MYRFMCTQQDDDGCATDPELGTCGQCGYIYHDAPLATDDAHGELCVLVQQRMWAAQQWDQPSLTARVDEARSLAIWHRSGPGFASMTNLARDYGLVPHAQSAQCPACPVGVRRLMLATSLLRYRYLWARKVPFVAVYGQTIWAEVRIAERGTATDL